MVLFSYLTCFMRINRYLTKICDQVVALLSAEHSASIVWGDEDDDTEAVDIDADGEDRPFTYEVAEWHEQEESASGPGFQVVFPSSGRKPISDRLKIHSRHISRYVPPDDCSVDPSIFIPRLVHGETAQGFWTVTYIPRWTPLRTLDQRPHSRLMLKRLLSVLCILPGYNAHSVLVMKIPLSSRSPLMRTLFESSST